jgi:hypothetical protein
MTEPHLTAARAERHEALVLKLEALLHELRPLALRQPAAAVPEDLRALAEGLLYDAATFAPRKERQPFPVAAPELGALALQLGQVLAALEAYEVRHTLWSREQGAYVWRLTRGGTTPVARLRPQLLKPAAKSAAADRHRAEVIRMIQARIDRAFAEGVEEGRQRLAE